MSRPLRILLLNERCHENPLSGGAETHLFEVFSRLAAPRGEGRDVRVDLLCAGFEGSQPTAEHRGVQVARLGSRFSYYARILPEVRRRVRRGEVDVVVEALNKLPFLTPLYVGVPVLAIHHHLHGLTAFRQVAPPLAMASVLLEQLVPLVYRRTPVVTISHSSKLELVRRGLPEQGIDVVPCGLDTDTHQPAALAGRRPLLVALGRVEPYKRLDLAIRAMPRILEAVPDAELAIVGRGQQEAALKVLARKLGVAERVRFHGFVSQAEKVSLLQQAALSVQCSRKEGWGLTVVESHACGTPVVAMDVPGLRDSVQEGSTGLLVQRAHPDTLASAVLKLLLNETRRIAMAREAMERARRFSWDETARDVGRVLAQLLEPKHSPITLPASLAECLT